jgi:hypothetical protein
MFNYFLEKKMKNKLLYFALITATENISCLKIDVKGERSI